MNAARAFQGVRPVSASVTALMLSALGVLIATWIIVGSDGDPSQVLWPLVVLPVVVCAVPVLAPKRGTRVGAAVVLTAWCAVAALSIGFLLWPALVALVVAASGESS